MQAKQKQFIGWIKMLIHSLPVGGAYRIAAFPRFSNVNKADF